MKPIILASSSPRRRELLSGFGLPLQFEASDLPEPIEAGSPKSTVMSLAFEKAHDVARRFPDQVVIGADTVVYKDIIFGKPTDAAEAKAMLKHLSGHWHSVYTGIALVRLEDDLKIIDVVETKVKMAHLDPERIQWYVDTVEPLDKAGSYGIQGKGALLVEAIEGDYFNVVGLPLQRLFKHLQGVFNIHLL